MRSGGRWRVRTGVRPVPSSSTNGKAPWTLRPPSSAPAPARYASAAARSIRPPCRAAPVAQWSHGPRTAADILLGSRNPMFLRWGPHLVQIYNDALRRRLG